MEISMSTVLVLGATGQVGSELAQRLEAAGHSVRRATSRPPQAGQVLVNLVTGEGVAEALAGVESAFLMAPPGYTNQDALLGPVIDAARAQRVRQIVLMTAMGADADPTAPMRRAELHLEQSGLGWNVIRPNWFMQNFHTYWRHGIVTANAIQLPVGHAKGSFIDTRDIADVAHVLLTTDTHRHRAFDLTGGDALSHDEVARILSTELQRTITFDDITPDAMRAGLLAAGLPEDYAAFMLTILHYFSLGAAARITDAVPTITGAAPRTFQQYARDYRDAF
jgi:uncharacterized protein YbjT (DUF2867 family)